MRRNIGVGDNVLIVGDETVVVYDKMLAMYDETVVVRKAMEVVFNNMRAKSDIIVAVFKWRLYVIKRWMYVMVLATSHKFVATYDKMDAVCNDVVATRDKIVAVHIMA
jgi:hypothetical protein